MLVPLRLIRLSDVTSLDTLQAMAEGVVRFELGMPGMQYKCWLVDGGEGPALLEVLIKLLEDADKKNIEKRQSEAEL